jgi:hypothetical protein
MRLLQQVRCPEDRGDPPYVGRITHIGKDVHANYQGVRYVWLTIQRTDRTPRTSHVWPSNRLDFTV